MSAASESELGLLHALVAKVLGSRITDPELCTSSDLSAAIKFLKDNNITASPEGSDALRELKEKVEAHGEVSSADDEELQRALDNVVNFPGSVANA